FSPCSAVCSALPGYLVLCLALQAPRLEAADFKVFGPDQPVIAIVGEDIVLPCHLSPRMSAENMEVTWFRSQRSLFVHRYCDGKDQYGKQMPDYQGRTELLKDGLPNGSIALRIFNIRPFDEGQYSCFVQDTIVYEEALLELKVAASGSAPHISIEHDEGGIRLVCRSSGWYPEPAVLWIDPRGQHVLSLSETNFQKVNELFEIENSIIITENSHQNLSCVVRNIYTKHKEKSTLFYISDAFFPRMNPWMVALWVILVTLFGFIGLTIYLFKIKARKHLLVGEFILSFKKCDIKREALVQPMVELEETLRDKSTLSQSLQWRRESFLAPATVTLDPDTAHPDLALSEDGKRVRRGDIRKDQDTNSERFEYERCTLGCESFTSGRHYWEVELGGGDYWAVGAASDSVKRKGEIIFKPEEGIWAVGHWGNKYLAATYPRSQLNLRWVPRRIRIFLDYDLGQVAFFDADKGALIFAFPTASFSEEGIRPFFWVWDMESQLRLCP
uniref:Butyrophilin subfamily 1 member A1 n=1 Tax=Pelodiscus sinensis TaxID=13735 RepID=K7FW33_PELSI